MSHKLPDGLTLPRRNVGLIPAEMLEQCWLPADDCVIQPRQFAALVGSYCQLGEIASTTLMTPHKIEPQAVTLTHHKDKIVPDDEVWSMAMTFANVDQIVNIILAEGQYYGHEHNNLKVTHEEVDVKPLGSVAVRRIIRVRRALIRQ